LNGLVGDTESRAKPRGITASLEANQSRSGLMAVEPRGIGDESAVKNDICGISLVRPRYVQGGGFPFNDKG
jgi:hypothetical protein